MTDLNDRIKPLWKDHPNGRVYRNALRWTVPTIWYAIAIAILLFGFPEIEWTMPFLACAGIGAISLFWAGMMQEDRPHQRTIEKRNNQ
jgi:hypothetical protein